MKPIMSHIVTKSVLLGNRINSDDVSEQMAVCDNFRLDYA